MVSYKAAEDLRTASAILAAQRHPWRSQGNLRGRRDARVRALVSAVWSGSPFYRELWASAGMSDPREIRTAEGLARLPAVTKDQLRQARYEGKLDVLSSAGATRRTSGSTGAPFEFGWCAGMTRLAAAVQFRALTMAGCRPWHRVASIRAQPVALSGAHDGATDVRYLGLLRARFLSYREQPEKVLESLASFRPHILTLYPSHARTLATALGTDRLRSLRLVAVSTNSEQSTKADRDQIGRWFGCPVFDDYGTEEVWAIANDCAYGTRHINDDLVWVDAMGPDGRPAAAGEPGQVVVTSLGNLATPFVRYALSDRAAVSHVRCPCGRNSPVLTKLEGRAQQVVKLPNGGSVSVGHLASTVNQTEGAGALREFQLVHDNPAHVTLYFDAPSTAQGALVAERAARRLESLAGGSIRVTPRGTDRFLSTPDGKKLVFVSRVGPVAAPAPSTQVSPEDAAVHR